MKTLAKTIEPFALAVAEVVGFFVIAGVALLVVRMMHWNALL